MAKKAKDAFQILKATGQSIVIEIFLESPTESNRSHGTKTVVDGKEVQLRDGKNYVIGKMFGKLPFKINGKTVKVNGNIILPVEETAADIENITLTPPPLIPPPTSATENE